MAQIELHPDFKDFLKLLNSHGVKYLVVGGYAVGYYGYPRATGDKDKIIRMGVLPIRIEVITGAYGSESTVKLRLIRDCDPKGSLHKIDFFDPPVFMNPNPLLRKLAGRAGDQVLSLLHNTTGIVGKATSCIRNLILFLIENNLPFRIAPPRLFSLIAHRRWAWPSTKDSLPNVSFSISRRFSYQPPTR
jgi:hypothetical protein